MLTHRRGQRLILAATQVVCEASAFLRNLILARLIGAEEMGLAIALALGIRLFEMSGEFALDRLLVQVEVEALGAMRSTVHLIQLAKGGLLALVAMLLAIPLAPILNPSMDPVLFAVAALALLIRGASHLDFRERQRQGSFAPALLVEGGSAVAGLITCGIVAWISRDYSALVWVVVVQAGAYCLFSHAVATVPYRLTLDSSLLNRCLGYGIPIALNGALMFLALQGDRLVVAMTFSAVELAGFALAAQLTLLPALIGARYLLASELPRLACLTRAQGGAAGCHCIALLRRVSVVAAAGALLLGASGNFLVSWLYGAEYTLPSSIYWLLAAASGLRFVRGVPGTMLMALERTHLLLLSNLPRIVTLPVAFWLASHGGGLTAIAAIAVSGEAMGLLVALAAVAGPPRSGFAGEAGQPA